MITRKLKSTTVKVFCIESFYVFIFNQIKYRFNFKQSKPPGHF